MRSLQIGQVSFAVADDALLFRVGRETLEARSCEAVAVAGCSVDADASCTVEPERELVREAEPSDEGGMNLSAAAAGTEAGRAADGPTPRVLPLPRTRRLFMVGAGFADTWVGSGGWLAVGESGDGRS
jgi:hypothetical protein